MYKIGVDIGGTNTDAVLVDNHNKIITRSKSDTTKDLVSGFSDAIKNVLHNDFNTPVSKVIAGTTHALNAILQAKDLTKIAVIRLAGYNLNSIPVCFNWPQNLKDAILADVVTVSGGYECDGNVISTLNEYEIRQAINELHNNGARGIAINGVFSCLYKDQEVNVKRWILEELGNDFPVTMSHEIGGMGFIERENATILNVALQKTLYLGFKNLHMALSEIGLHESELLISKNDGTVMSVSEAIKYPVLTLCSGPKNSFIGASKLAGVSDAVVVDVGGTSTDIGVIANNFTRRSYKSSSIANISLGFSMPDVISIALGGGSHVNLSPTEPFNILIGPQSVGRDLLTKAKSFGGEQLTLSDAGIALDRFKDIKVNKVIDKDTAIKILSTAYNDIYTRCKKIRGINEKLPIVMVGGGAEIFNTALINEYDFIMPEFGASANAYGAALSEIGATINKIIDLNDRDRQIELLKEQVFKQALARGAKNPRIVELEIMPYHYAANKIARVIITAAGIMDTLSTSAITPEYT